jgi:hypothetical protein
MFMLDAKHKPRYLQFMQTTQTTTPPPIAGASDRERETRLEAERVTLEIRFGRGRSIDAGRVPIEHSPLFGGAAQSDLFGGSN